MSDERESLAEAERIVRNIGDMDYPYTHRAPAARKVMAEYDRRGQEIDGLKHRLECETSFTAAHQASALKWAALVAEQKDDIEQARAERDEALGLLRELADWADLAYRDVDRPDGAEVIADALALVERTSQRDRG